MTTRLASRFAISAVLAAFAFTPAEAAWHGFLNREIGFSFNAPGEMKTQKTTFRIANAAAPRPATLYHSVEDNIEYNVTVVDVGPMSEEDALKAASAAFQGSRKVLSNEEARADSSYGHKMSVELPNNGGRSSASIFFKNGHLIQLDATVLPANGDYGTPDLARFVDSIAFYDGRVDSDATELKLEK